MCIILKLLVIWHLLVSTQIEADRRIFQGEELKTTKEIPIIVEVLVTVKAPGPGVDGEVGGCGGSYIRANWILSATHCIKTFFPLTNHMGKNDVKLCMGEAHYDSCPEKNRRLADGLYPHTEGDPAYAEHDILLIHIAKPWVLGPTIQLAKLPTTKVDKKSFIGKQCMVAGWGYTSPTEPGVILKKATVKIIEPRPEKCGKVNAVQLCAGFVTGVTCLGDSGGPLVLDNTLIGVVKSGTGKCNTKEKTSKFNLVQDYKDWIVSIAGPDPPGSASSIPQNKFTLPIVFVISLFNFILN